MTTLGASSDSLMIKLETDFGPLVSLLLNSLVLISLVSLLNRDEPVFGHNIPEHFICKLWIVVLLC